MSRHGDARPRRAWSRGLDFLARKRVAPGPPGPDSRPSRVDRLLGSGLFDAGYYVAAAGLDAPSDEDAARHCVDTGMPEGLPFHPLVDVDAMPKKVRQAWRRGQVGVVLRHLGSAASAGRRTGPLFDPSRVAGPDAPAAEALAEFLRTARPDSPMPVPSTYRGPTPTWGTTREALLAQARQVGASTPRPRVSTRAAVERDGETLRARAATARRGDGPAVTVLMPPPSSAEALRAAYAELGRQRMSAWQLVVALPRDASPVLGDAADELAAADPRVLPVADVSRPHGPGDCPVRAAVAAELVAVHDPAIAWHPDFLWLMVAGAAAGGHSAVQSWRALPLETDDQASVTHAAVTYDELLVDDDLPLSGVLVSRQLADSTGADLCHVPGDEAAGLDLVLSVARTTPWHVLPVLREDDQVPDHEPGQPSSPHRAAVLQRHLLQSLADERTGPATPGRVSVVVPTFQDYRLTVAAVRAALDHGGEHDLEVVVVDNGSRLQVGARITAAFLTDDRVHYLRLPRNYNFATACNIGQAVSRGETVVFLNNDTLARSGWLDALLAPLDDPSVRGTQPLLLYPDDSIQTAGTWFPVHGQLPCHFLVGHPPEDARSVGARPFSVVTAAAVALRAAEFEAVGGFDTIFVNGMEDVDLCLRLTDRFGGGFRVVPASRVTHLEGKSPGRGTHIARNRSLFMDRWRDRLPASDADRLTDLGLTLAEVGADQQPVPMPRPVLARAATPARASLRWGLKLPSTPGPWGDAWGDTHLALSLGEALRGLGHDVVTYRRGAHDSRAAQLDDVVLGIRGLEPVRPVPGKLNILWVISHPDEVDVEELRAFDVVLAASTSWSERMSAVSGRPVHVMHQAVDVQGLPDLASPPGDGSRPVFVGGVYGDRRRPVVHDALEAGVDLAVHGPGWEGLLPQGVLHSGYVPNREVPAVYHRHGLVLADHWPDMARNGFVANRVFDAVAAGARVVSDDVEGVTALFGGVVQVYRSVDELAMLCSPEGRSRFPDDAGVAAEARRVRREESFDARARTLVEIARERLG